MTSEHEMSSHLVARNMSAEFANVEVMLPTDECNSVVVVAGF